MSYEPRDPRESEWATVYQIQPLEVGVYRDRRLVFQTSVDDYSSTAWDVNELLTKALDRDVPDWAVWKIADTLEEARLSKGERGIFQFALPPDLLQGRLHDHPTKQFFGSVSILGSRIGL